MGLSQLRRAHAGDAGGTWDVVPLCFTSVLVQVPNAAWAAPQSPETRGPFCVRMGTGRIQVPNPRRTEG